MHIEKLSLFHHKLYSKKPSLTLDDTVEFFNEARELQLNSQGKQDRVAFMLPCGDNHPPCLVRADDLLFREQRQDCIKNRFHRNRI